MELNHFTPRAQLVLVLARKEAGQFGHKSVDADHLLLGLIGLGQGVAVNILRSLGLELENVRDAVKLQPDRTPGEQTTGNIHYSPGVKRVLALAAKDAKSLNHTYVGIEHILLGMLADGDGAAARVLKHFNVDLAQTRSAILKELEPNFEP